MRNASFSAIACNDRRHIAGKDRNTYALPLRQSEGRALQKQRLNDRSA